MLTWQGEGRGFTKCPYYYICPQRQRRAKNVQKSVHMVLWMTPSLVYAVKASKRNDDDGSFMSWLGLVCFSSLELVYFRRELEKHLKIGKLPRLLFISIITTTFTEIFLVRELSVSLYLKYLEVPVWRHDTMYFYKIFSLYFANFCANVRNLYKNYFSTRRNFLSEGSRH